MRGASSAPASPRFASPVVDRAAGEPSSDFAAAGMIISTELSGKGVR